MDEYPKIRDIEILPILEDKKKKLFLSDPRQVVENTLTLPYRNILIIKFLDAVLDYLVFALEAELLLYFDLHRKAVRIPSRLALHTESLHTAQPADEVLDSP